YVLQQKDVRLIFSAPVRPGHPMAPQIAEHGDFVQDIAFEVDDVDWAFKSAVSRGARPAYEPVSLVDDSGSLRVAGIHIYGDTLHSLINRDNYKGHIFPHCQPVNQPGDPIGIIEIDHCVGNVELGHMDEW